MVFPEIAPRLEPQLTNRTLRGHSMGGKPVATGRKPRPLSSFTYTMSGRVRHLLVEPHVVHVHRRFSPGPAFLLGWRPL